VNVSGIQAIAQARDEQIGRNGTLSPVVASSEEVPLEHLAGGRMQRDETVLAELGAADRQDCGPEVDISKLEIERFAQPQARDAQQSVQAVKDPRPQRAAFIAARHDKSGAQQAADLVVRVQIGPCPLRLER